MRASDFYDLVSGRRRGLGAACLRTALAVAEGPYRAGVWWRNRRYDTKPELTSRVEVPVLSVGNLTLGGSGKTPMVKHLCRRLRDRGVRVSILSRGYGAQEGGPNDEALELEQSLPDVPHLQNPDRVAAARVAIDELATQAIVLDDGFQHRRLARDLDMVLLDATEPFGFGRVFPRGALREPVASLTRANVVCLTRSDLVSEVTRGEVRERVADVAPHALWCESVMAPRSLLGIDRQGEPECEEPIETLRGRKVMAVSGIGNPSAFRSTLEGQGAVLKEFLEFPDHHAYRREDIERMEESARECDPELVVCTHKDLVKILLPAIGETPLRALTIEAQLTVGEAELDSALDRFVERVTPDE